MEDSLGTSSSSSASHSSEESKESLRAREPSLRSGLARNSNLRVTRTRAAQRKTGKRLSGTSQERISRGSKSSTLNGVLI